ncbi:MAG: hypothetical protein IPH36_22325 [Saprospiraceae bacterium]|nr:hypothetical protein [Saprospiraceae bacterium]
MVLGFLMMSCIIQAQEDCTNGVDDDNDGLIDLWDTECFCVQSNGTLYFSDFETFDCCPWRYTIPSAPGGIDCLLGMSSATEATVQLHWVQCFTRSTSWFPFQFHQEMGL